MNVGGYGVFVVFALVVAYAIRWLDPALLSQLSRTSGLTSRTAWGFAVVAFLWMFLPILFGAPVDVGLWPVGTVFVAVGWFLLAFAVSSRDEYAMLQRATPTDPQDVTAGLGDDLVATSGTPEPVTGDDIPVPVSLSTGTPAVYVSWIIQRRRRTGIHTSWRNVATDVHTTPFTLGDEAVLVTPGEHRTFPGTKHEFTVQSGDEVPDETAAFMASHPDLPDPAGLENPIKIIETVVPADEPVTVIGTASQAVEPETSRIDTAPVDELLSTHADHATPTTDGTPDDGGHDEDGEVILISGEVDDAKRLVKREVCWLGAAGVVLILGGQAAALWLAGVSVF